MVLVGCEGARPLVALWRLMYERFTKHHQLNNLIWVFTGTGNDWYPGDDYVDILGVDAYPQDRHDPLKPIWETLQGQFAGKKLVALTEFGGVPDIMEMLARWCALVLLHLLGGNKGQRHPGMDETGLQQRHSGQRRVNAGKPGIARRGYMLQLHTDGAGASEGGVAMQWQEHITIDPNIVAGKPIIKGTAHQC